ncbi:transcription antitermination protein NusB [Mycoplasmopsis caviae]|uniref:Transcription antitermination protein NusB n=1 Tax=Mycoplasmopsis caviae TaxID=55603 RepID=A0A3P8LIH9_9BACT|nr:transcription antitermination factor NusB [Mycoplasmopsis caviae]UUD34899.1 transcription antitermination protein NusB [Mycoplasmopsis caviae]VDR42262.1 transcription termination factor [Mycoplasmopsis caviae]
MQNRRQFRLGIINVLYRYELMEQKININELFESESNLSNEQFLHLEKISKNYEFYKKSISQFFKESWIWERVSPLIRAILINGAHELMSIEPKIIINESVEITKYYFDSEKNFFKMVNAILENVYKFFVLNEIILKKQD